MIDGAWKINLHSPMGDKKVIGEFKSEGGTLTGTLSSPDTGWNTGIYEGTVNGDEFRFKADFPVPGMGSFTFTLTGKVDGDAFAGIAKMAIGKCKFEAVRA